MAEIQAVVETWKIPPPQPIETVIQEMLEHAEKQIPWEELPWNVRQLAGKYPKQVEALLDELRLPPAKP